MFVIFILLSFATLVMKQKFWFNFEITRQGGLVTLKLLFESAYNEYGIDPSPDWIMLGWGQAFTCTYRNKNSTKRRI